MRGDRRDPTAVRRAVRGVAAAVALAGAGLLAAPSRAQNDGYEPSSAGPEYRNATREQQVDLLRKLLGVPVEEPAPAASDPAPEAAAAPTGPQTGSVEPPAVEAAPSPAKTAPAPSARRRSAPKPPPTRAPRRAPQPVPAAPPSDDAAAPPPAVAPAAPAPEQVATRGLAQLSETDLPPVGTVVSSANLKRWSHVLTPAMQWAARRGVTAEVIEPKSIEMEPWRVAATERYSGQVELDRGRKTLRNYVAGIPFPNVEADDPDVALKVMFNFENRVNFDDLDGQDFGCITGAIEENEGLTTRRDGRFGHLRRLYYTGRLRIDPKPMLPNNEGIRYRESLFPVIQPFNNKGAGFSYVRYLDGRQDDAWLYLPAARRVRRLSTAQRSEGIFGTDLDLDSYGGFAGNPAWFDWTLLGKKTLLGPFHAKHQPVRWCEKPGDFMFCDAWEPREFFIIAARSLIPGYNFSLRVLYVDVETYGIPFTEVYDNDGQLWRGYIQQYKAGLRRSMPESSRTYEADMVFLGAVTVFDMQLNTSSRCEFPASDSPNREGWVYYAGDDGGPEPEDFEVASFIKAGR